MAVAVGIIGIAVVVAAVVWFALGHGPFDEEGVDRPPERRRNRRQVGPTRGHFGPGGPGAESQAPRS